MARNEYFKEPKHIQHSLEVTNSISKNNAMLLPALQNQAMFVPNGNALDLHCAPTSVATAKGNAIRWTFSPRSGGSSSANEVPTQNPNRLHIASTTVEQNDGIYKCHFGDEYQVSNKRTIKKIFTPLYLGCVINCTYYHRDIVSSIKH